MPAISAFGEDVLKKLAPLLDRVELNRKDHLVRQNQQSQYVWIVAEGQLHSTFTNYYDQECNLLHFGQYELIGLESILKQPSPLNVMCYSELAICYRIATDRLLKVLKDYAPMGQ